ncbi:MAG: DUF6898 family protein [Oceanicaulis sp.]
MAPRDPLSGREVIFEFVSLGDSVRVAAVDVATGEEVVVTGPVATPQRDLERIAGRKLARKLGLAPPDDLNNKTPRRGGRGVIV